MVHKDDERIDEDDLIQRQQLLAKEPDVPEMYNEVNYNFESISIFIF